MDSAGDLTFGADDDEAYRTCAECGGDCAPEPTTLEGVGVRIAFICPTHGVHSVFDPFENKR